MKRPRLITVDGVPYRWRIRRRPALQGPLAFAVERADRRGTVLLASVPAPGTPPPSASALVTAAVKQARAAGWRPETPGPAFSVTVTPETWLEHRVR
ncbi:hypothetical protein [Actinoplanes couchii]|uniref:Uncharacterized protein n=1 Tax=Actinoplanes couchii TaxID=403638 RepID=A0ABQ3XHM9_9ACTN|nr:hypothetical protein [Actinoplanes couchii]MDR6317617.1 hypothetical protein [Actinoplanes couchii]GID58001.1 hypothetical protein Aco03nite_064050 [Actinoplanes couchii]